ncbi:hypothetical protein [Rhizobacter sp. SG703]|uniref:hypothetical protein n=1 Tax=Rhizobacter sp. SG703 TaxID=2587140 RepID=UPI001444AE79|nr:hypothetical protein [Rhizobacter sp. SG703]NKI92801.1 hypothetical protein [Rhizobacter sp. SG703]
MTSRLSAVAFAFALFATASLGFAAQAHSAAHTAARAKAEAEARLPVVQMPAVMVIGKRVKAVDA